MKLEFFEKSYISFFPKFKLGLKKIVLSDFSYGEFIIYRNDVPFYYLNIFEEKYIRLKKYIEETNKNADEVLNEIIQSIEMGLHLEKTIWGIEIFKKEKVVSIEVDEFPIVFVDNYLNHRAKNI